MGLNADRTRGSHLRRVIRHPRPGERSLSIEMEVGGLIVTGPAATWRFTIDEAFGGWEKAQAAHFADGGVFDQIYTPGK
jgi:hypothetical protein